MTFDIKYRPKTLDSYLGSDGMKRVLRAKSLRGTLFNRSYLFGGPKGCGKTTVARWVAKSILCKSKVESDPCNLCSVCLGVDDNSLPGFDEIDAAVSGNVDRIREIISDAGYLSLNGDKRIVIMDEAHRLNSQSQDILLKALEDRILIALFCTTEPEKIRPAIRSRLEEYHIKPPSTGDLTVWASRIASEESVSLDEDLLPVFVERCGHCPRVVAANLALLSDIGGLNTENLRTIFDTSLPEAVVEYIKSFSDKAERIRLTSDIVSNFNAKTFIKEVVHVVSLRKRIDFNISVSYPISLMDIKITDSLMDMIKDALSYPDINETVLTFIATKDWKSKSDSVVLPSSVDPCTPNDKPKNPNKVIEIDGIRYNKFERLTSLDDKMETPKAEEKYNSIEAIVEFNNLKVPMAERDFGREFIRRIKN